MAGLEEVFATPDKVLVCRSGQPDLSCRQQRDLCCQCCNLGTLVQQAAGNSGCMENEGAVKGDCKRIFNYCCYNRGKQLSIWPC